MKVYIALAVSLLMTGCQTEGTAKRFSDAQNNVLTCQQAVMAYKQKMASARQVQFKDERNALMYMVVQELAKVKASDEMASCSTAYIAMVNADSAKTAGLTRMGTSLGGIGLGIVGLGIISNGITDLANGGGSSSNTNITNSRVVNRSSGSSASGTGLGEANTFNSGSGQTQGGFLPRQMQDITGTGSNSGESMPDISLQPEQLPVEVE